MNNEEVKVHFELPTSAIIVVSVNFRVFLGVDTYHMFALFHYFVIEFGFFFIIA